MGVVHKYSEQITNRDAIPQVKNNAGIANAPLYRAYGKQVIANGDSANSTYALFSLPSNAVIHRLLFSCEDAGTAGTIHIGLRKTPQNDSTVVDADFFASSQVMTTALNDTDLTYENAVLTRYNKEQPLWEALSLTSDPNLIYDVYVTLTVATDVGSDILIACECEYSTV